MDHFKERRSGLYGTGSVISGSNLPRGTDLDPMALFLGPDPWVVMDGAGDPAPEALRLELQRSGARSVLFQAQSGPGTPWHRFLRLMEACHRDLPPGGRLAVLAGNRTQRRLAALKALAKGRGRSTDGHRHGGDLPLRALLRAIRDAGFMRVSVYAGTPSSDGLREARALSQRDRWTAPVFLIVADRDGQTPEFPLDQMASCLQRHFDATDRPPSWRLERLLNSFRGKSVAVLGAGERRAIIRIPRSELMREDEGRSDEVLRKIQVHAGVSARVPRPILNGQAGDISFFAQTHLKGVPLSTQISSRNRQTYLREASQFLRALNPGLSDQPVGPASNPSGLAGCDPIRDFVLQCVSDPDLRARAAALLNDSLQGAESRLGVVHGDFGASNILVRGSRITGVIDWEAARDNAPPVLDAFNYLDSVHRSCEGDVSILDTLPLLANGEWPVSGEMEFLREFFAYCGTDLRFRKGFALLYALFHIGPQLRFQDRDPGPAKRLEELLRRLLA